MRSTALVSFFTLCAFAATRSAAVMSCQQWMAYRTGATTKLRLGL